ncbi:lysine-specific demethylase 4A-like protein [Tribonema minus]|uniref:Lysine-specific demethylase 4A-like protein n=1 Tax=Tribonema minus TaxID=303371 RepID=A0A835Z284_9STRA|nr:lysine-specific demethylase 4A-like protein [Tribonema minus]
MLYVGTWRALFAWHVEDMNLCSINYIHRGAHKSWYSVPPSSADAFERLARAHFAGEFASCPEYLRHKTTLLSPAKLDEANVPYSTCLQSEGEIIITWPASYHCGFNHGFNIAESSNFAIERWLKEGRRAGFCKCRPHSVRIDVGTVAHLYRTSRARRPLLTPCT